MDFNSVITYLRARFEDYHDAVVTRVDEQFVTHHQQIRKGLFV